MISNSILAPLLLAAVPAVAIPADPMLAELRRCEAPALATLRAGAPIEHELSPATRSELRQAEQSSSDLAALRAGDLDENEMLIIGITLLAVILLILIL